MSRRRPGRVRPSPVKSPATMASGVGPHRVRDLGLERAVAVAQQDRHVVRAVVGDGQVGAAVAVEVPRHDGFWFRTVRVNRDRLKRWSGRR